jgi:hypothetical protein
MRGEWGGKVAMFDVVWVYLGGCRVGSPVIFIVYSSFVLAG